MPKAAFHLLWDRLKAGQTTGVYVRNRSSDGRGYWVFAIVVPVPDGFLSVRIKPGTAIFDRVRDIYAEVRASEAEGVPPAQGAAALVRCLGEAGFPSYDSFQARTLAAEVVNRAERSGRPGPNLGHVMAAAEAADGIGTELMAMQRLLQAGLTITMNLRLVAARLGERGRALSAIADNYALLSHEMTSWLSVKLSDAEGSIGDIARLVCENLLLTAATALLDEMSDTFAQDAEHGLGDPEAERARLSDVATHYRSRAKACNERALQAVDMLNAHLARMRHHVDALDAIRMLCRIEGAGLRDAGAAVEEIVRQLDGFQDELGLQVARTLRLGQDVERGSAAD